MKFAVKTAVTRCAIWASFAAVIFCVRSRASADHNPPPEIPIQQWLQGPDRRDFDWKVILEPPSLTFQQRHLQKIQTTFSVGKLLKAGVSLSDLHLVVKFAVRGRQLVPRTMLQPFQTAAGSGAEGPDPFLRECLLAARKVQSGRDGLRRFKPTWQPLERSFRSARREG